MLRGRGNLYPEGELKQQTCLNKLESANQDMRFIVCSSGVECKVWAQGSGLCRGSANRAQ